MDNKLKEQDHPPSSILTKAINFLYERFGTRLLKNKKELINIIDEAQESGLMDEEARDTMQRVLQVSDLQVRDIMIPSAQMVVVEENMPMDQTLDVLVESAHSRFPVMNTEKDEVLGILLAKDMLRFFDLEDDDRFDLPSMLRKPVFVPESKRVNILLAEFRQKRNHMAIVVDEYGAVSDEFNKYFKTSLTHERADTMGGLISQELGRVPAVGDILELGKIKFEVINADSRRVHLVRVFIQ